jgi:hypothetical protein
MSPSKKKLEKKEKVHEQDFSGVSNDLNPAGIH